MPVEGDGSAYFKAPALRSLFFVALDAEGRAVKRMQSFTQVMPGEKQGCVGCHENKTENTVRRAATVSKALARGPSEIDPSGLAFDVADFPRDVQPILDRACVRCHNPDRRCANVDLSGDHGPMFSMAYYNLIAHNQVLDGRNSSQSDWPPYARGSGGSPLMEKISGRHHGAVVTPAERKVIMMWLDGSAPYPGTYGALGCGSIGGYHQNKQVVNNDRTRAASVAANAVIARRCDSCHKGATRLPHCLSDENGISFWTPDWNDPRLRKWHRHLLFNLTHPEKSLFLKAPLAKSAGGFGMGKDGKAVFASADDPDYKAILAMIQDGKAVLEKVKRFDMKGFRPPKPYIRELKRYGVLPGSFDDEKDPMFFLDVVEACPDIQFRLVSPYSSRPPSTNEIVMRRLKKIVEKRGSNLRIVDTSSKVRYYECLSKAWVQFNCAIQDWVSWTLVEATMFNCHPLYPNWKDFPRELHNRRQNIYRRKDLADCVAKLRRLMSLYDKGVTGGCSFVYKKHDMSWGKYLKIMGFN